MVRKAYKAGWNKIAVEMVDINVAKIVLLL